MDSSCSSISSNHSNEEVDCSSETISVNNNLARNPISAERGSLEGRTMMAPTERPTETYVATKARAKADFSIDAILSSRTSTPVVVVSPPEMFSSESKTRTIISHTEDPQFSWVYCTRYRPPKLPSKFTLN